MDTTNDSFIMKDIYFNELSIPCIVQKSDIDSMIRQYAVTVKEAVSLGFNKVRYANGVDSIMLKEDYSLKQYMIENNFSTSVMMLLATQAKPYIQDDTENEKSYVENEYRLVFNGKEIKAEGFSSAAIDSSMAIGLLNNEWNNNSYKVLVFTDNNGFHKDIEVLYAYHPCHFSYEKIMQWVDTNLPPNINECNILPADKVVKLSQHHGYDVLEKFANRLKCETYIVEIVNSIDRDSKEKNFISGFKNDNIVYITLVNDGGFGLAAKTTARNIRELRYIAKLIEEKYS